MRVEALDLINGMHLNAEKLPSPGGIGMLKQSELAMLQSQLAFVSGVRARSCETNWPK